MINGVTNVSGTFDCFLMKTNSAGQFLWAKTYEHGDNVHQNYGWGISQTPQGNYAFCDFAQPTGTFNNEVLVIVADSNGNSGSGCPDDSVMFTETNPLVASLIPVFTIDTMNVGTAIVPSDTSSVYSPSSANPCIPSSISFLSQDKNATTIFPNPFFDRLNFTGSNNTLSEIILYDIASRKLLQQKFTNAITISTEQLAKGLYLYEVRDRKGLCKKGKV